jgi:hypothetical protein
VLTVTQLLELLGCSLRTLQRRLKTWQACTSYNRNACYYTLPDIPVFDTQGLWHCRGISFSKHGNLKNTLVSLVHDSGLGLSAAEIGELLGLDPRSFLSHFQDEPGLYREKVGGRFIWFAGNVAVRKPQQQRRAELQRQERMALPSDREAVLILVDLLHHPGTDPQAIARRLRSKNVKLAPETIRTFLLRHDLQKKTMGTGSSVV